MSIPLTYAVRFEVLAERARALVQDTEIAYSVACVSLGVVDTRRSLLGEVSPAENARIEAARANADDLVKRLRHELFRATRTLEFAEQHRWFNLLDERRVGLPVLRTDSTLTQKRAHLANLAMLAHDYAVYVLKGHHFALTSYADGNNAVTITFSSDKLPGGSRWTISLSGEVQARRAQPSEAPLYTFNMLTSPAEQWIPDFTLVLCEYTVHFSYDAIAYTRPGALGAPQKHESSWHGRHIERCARQRAFQ